MKQPQHHAVFKEKKIVQTNQQIYFLCKEKSDFYITLEILTFFFFFYKVKKSFLKTLVFKRSV